VSLRLSPNQGFFNTLHYLGRFIAYVLLIYILPPLAWALVGLPIDKVLWGYLGFSFLFALGDAVISQGGIKVIQHVWLRYQLERDDSIPRNLTTFLDHASALILLRKVGGGYIFIHRYLLEHFAAGHSNPQENTTDGI
ncbi:MAG: hypothetical protein AAF125_07940, partial [Chloroflexota bacterium]